MLIKFENVSVKNPSSVEEQKLLDCITFTIEKNQFTTLVGPNGAGKTTVIKVMLGLMDYQGQITKAKNLKIGYIPQKFDINNDLPMSVESYINLMNGNVFCPYDLTTLQKKSLHSLSGGERQKLLVNCAVANEPDLIILDEPTQGIDQKGQKTFYKLLKDQKKLGRSILLVSHEPNYVFDLTDQVICLNNHICCHGSPENVSHSDFAKSFGLTPYVHHHNHSH